MSLSPHNSVRLTGQVSHPHSKNEETKEQKLNNFQKDKEQY